jgi:hypothetical protein
MSINMTNSTNQFQPESSRMPIPFQSHHPAHHPRNYLAVPKAPLRERVNAPDQHAAAPAQNPQSTFPRIYPMNPEPPTAPAQNPNSTFLRIYPMNPEPRHPRQPPNPRFRVSTLRLRGPRRQSRPRPPPQSAPPKTCAQPWPPGARSNPRDAMPCTVNQLPPRRPDAADRAAIPTLGAGPSHQPPNRNHPTQCPAT